MTAGRRPPAGVRLGGAEQRGGLMPKRVVICGRCKRERKVHARGLCRSCYQYLWDWYPEVLKGFSVGKQARQ